MASALIARSLIVVFGLLYPAYNSYKAIKTRDVKGYVKWMIYWIVFALFYNVETITDLVFSWLPLYYELKVIFVIWLLSPQTQGSDVIYRMYVHPHLTKHEEELDKVWDKFKDQSYSALVKVGVHGANLALQGAIKGQTALAEQLTKSQSSEAEEDNSDTIDHVDGEEFFEETVIEELIDVPAPIRGPGGRTLNRSQSLLTHRHDKPQPYQRRHGTDSVIYDSDVSYTLRKSRPSESAYQPAEELRDSVITRRNLSRPSTSGLDDSPSVRKRYSTPLESPTFARPVLRFDPEETRATRSRTNNQRKSASDSLFQHTQKSQSTSHKQSANRRQSSETSQSKSSKSSDINQSKSSKSHKQKAVVTKTTDQEETETTDQEETNPSNKPIEEKPKTTEEKLLYKTKKISDIKHHKIKSPFLTMW